MRINLDRESLNVVSCPNRLANNVHHGGVVVVMLQTLFPLSILKSARGDIVSTMWHFSRACAKDCFNWVLHSPRLLLVKFATDMPSCIRSEVRFEGVKCKSI